MQQTINAVDLSPFVPRIATAWAAEAPEQRARTLDGSLVFADISGFTALSERLAKRGPIGAEELTGVLGDCFAGLLAVAYAEGGGLLKFGGDALLLLFDGPGHELRATRAALGMRSAIRTVGRLQTSVGNVRLRMSQGVHSGPIDLFRVGRSHEELIVCGPTASEVIRMETVADAGEIVVSTATATALEHVAPAVLGDRKGPGVLLRARTVVHVVEGFPTAVSAPDIAARSVPLAVREHLLDGGGEPEHRHVAIAFVHFDGTDALRAAHGTDAVADALDELVRVTQGAVEAEDVTFLATDIDKDGGKIILVSGAPTAYEDAEGRLLRVVRRIADANTRLPVRIGVNRGHVFSGCVGPPYRQTYTVMGDAVNLSARLMAKAAPGEVVVHPSVLELSRTAFATTAMEPFLVKGKTAPITAVVLGDAVGTQDVRPATVTRSPMVGRDRELETLLRVASEGGAVVDIVGEAGLGKTRLLHEIRERHDGAVRIVSCEQYQRSTPYFAASVLLRAVLALGPEATARDAVAAVGSVDESLERWAPLLGDVLDIPIDDTPSTRRIRGAFRRQRARVFVADLLRDALGAGAVVAFDDIQWIDDASSEVVTELASGMETAPWTLIATRRDGQSLLAGATPKEIELKPLAHADARALVAAATRDSPLPPDRVRALIDRAGGNPLFLEELVRASTATDDALPDSLDALIASQIDALPPANRKLLRFAAVLGESFDAELFVDVVAEPGLRGVESAVSRLDGFIERTNDGRLQFRHRLLRDVAYQALPFRIRRDLHGRAAQVIERRAGDAVDDVAAVLSLHCLHAQQYEKCWDTARTAALRAMKKHASVEACDLYERGLLAVQHVPEAPSADIAEALRGLSIARRTAGRYAQAQSALERARKLTADPIAVARLQILQADLAALTGSSSTAFRWVKRTLRLLDDAAADEPDVAETLRAVLLVKAAELRHQAGKPREALRYARSALDAAKGAGDDATLARAYAALDWSHIALGRPDEAVWAATAIDLLERADDFENLAIVANNRGAFEYFSGDWAAALANYERARAAFDEIGDVVHAAMATCNIAEIHTDQGRLDEAEAALQSALDTWRAMRFPVGIAFARRFLGRVALRKGHPERAMQLFDQARSTFEGSGMAPKMLEVDTWRAECLLQLGDVLAARTLLDDCLERSVATNDLVMRAMIHRLRCYAAISAGDHVTAWAEIDASLDVATSRRMSYDVALALEAMSVLADVTARPSAHDVSRVEPLLRSLGVIAPPKQPIALAG